MRLENGRKMEREKTFQRAMQKAQKWLGKNYSDSCVRKTLRRSMDCYGNKDNRVELILIEGSPARGYILVDYHISRMLCVSFLMSKTYKISWGHS